MSVEAITGEPVKKGGGEAKLSGAPLCHDPCRNSQLFCDFGTDRPSLEFAVAYNRVLTCRHASQT